MIEYQFWVLVGMLASGFGWLIHQNSKIKDEISAVKDRLSRLEGRFEERGYWESRKQQDVREIHVKRKDKRHS